MGGGGGPGDGPREGDGGGQGQGQPQVLQTYGGRAADGGPEEGQRETRMETKGDQYFKYFSVYIDDYFGSLRSLMNRNLSSVLFV